MGLFDKFRERFAAPAAGGSRGDARPGAGVGGLASASGQDPDEIAVERYRYMLRTAPPETLEQAHTEAFARLTPDQRRSVLEDLGAVVPASERATSEDPQSLARMATRAEMRQPGTLERTFGGARGGMGGGMGMGGMIAGTLLASVAGAFIGTAIADAFFDDELDSEAMAGGEDMAGGDPGGEMGDLGGMEDFEV